LAPHTVEEYLVNELVKDSANYDLIRSYLERLDKKVIIDLFDKFLEKEDAEVRIPLAALSNRKLSGLESTIKFLRENLGLSNNVVSNLVGRSNQVCWTTYNNTKKKMPETLDATASKHDIPVSVLRSKLSVLESIVVYLREREHLNYHDIAKLLARDDRTIWTVFNRSRAKRLNEKRNKE
jgi:hypothetical protein